MGMFADLAATKPSHEPRGPEILGLNEYSEEPEPRAKTEPKWQETRHHRMQGRVSVTLYESVDDANRGGVIITLQAQEEEGSFRPFVRMLKDGTAEIHL